MLNKRIILAAVVGLIMVPAAAYAADSADSFFGKNSGTKPGVSFGVVKPGESRPVVRAPAGPSRGGGGFISGALEASQAALRASMVNRVEQANLGCLTQLAANPVIGSLSPQCIGTEAATTPIGAAAPAAPVDAPQLAERAAGQLNLPTPDLRTSPADPVKALVGLQTWLWVPEGQWSPLTESASAGGATVTVTAEPIQARWDMGEGTVNCAGPGREWRKGLGQNARTDCGYTYERTSTREDGGKYDVSALLRYSITWECEGDCSQAGGDLGTLDSPASTGQLEVSERQSVVIR